MNPDPAALRCDPETAAAIRAMVRTWPRLTEAQKARLAVLLAPPPRDEGGDAEYSATTGR